MDCHAGMDGHEHTDGHDHAGMGVQDVAGGGSVDQDAPGSGGGAGSDAGPTVDSTTGKPDTSSHGHP